MNIPPKASNVTYSRDFNSQLEKRCSPIPDNRHTRTAIKERSKLMEDYPKSMCIGVQCDLELGDGFYSKSKEIKKMKNESDNLITVCWATNWSVFEPCPGFDTTDFGAEFIKGLHIDDEETTKDIQ